MEPEDRIIEDLDDFENLYDPDEWSTDFDHFDEHMDPCDKESFY